MPSRSLAHPDANASRQSVALHQPERVRKQTRIYASIYAPSTQMLRNGGMQALNNLPQLI
jgi:hypothetical protein